MYSLYANIFEAANLIVFISQQILTAYSPTQYFFLFGFNNKGSCRVTN